MAGDECSSGEGAGFMFGYGEEFVGPGLTKWVIRSGVLAGVTLSIHCQAGSRRTVVLWSEWSGTGMSVAESMSFWRGELASVCSFSLRLRGGNWND